MPTGKIIRNSTDCSNREPYRTLIDLFELADRELSFLELQVLLSRDHKKKHRVEDKLSDLQANLLSNRDLKLRWVTLKKKGYTKQNLNYFLRTLIKWNWIKWDTGYQLLSLSERRRVSQKGESVPFTSTQFDKILRRYQDLANAKELIARLKGWTRDEVQQKLDEMRDPFFEDGGAPEKEISEEQQKRSMKYFYKWEDRFATYASANNF